jgi:hypothetical protein
MLTIENLDSIIGKEIQTTNAMWKVVDIMVEAKQKDLAILKFI